MTKVLVLVGAVLTCVGLALTFIGGGDSGPAPSASSASSTSTPQDEVSTPSSSSSAQPTTSSSTEESSSTSRAPRTTSSTSSSTEEPDGHDHGDGPAAERQAATAKPASKVAAQLVKVLARTDQSAAAWRRDAGELMSSDGRGQLAEMEPADVPFTRVTGKARLVMTNQPSSVTLPIGVPTDEGMWLVMVTEEDGKWKALSFSQMEGFGDE